jgi:hypothetical protein
VADRWSNHVLTRGIVLGEWYGATWPSHGLPRGTPHWLTVFGLKVCLRVRGGRTRDLHGGEVLAGSGYQPAYMVFLITYGCKIYI